MGTTCCQATDKIHIEPEIANPDSTPTPTTSPAAILLNQFMSSHPTIQRALLNQQQLKNQKQQSAKQKLLKSALPTHELEGKFIGLHSRASHVEQFAIMIYNNDEYYEGFWQDGHRNGKGILVNKEGEYYCGQWKQSLPHGFGTYQYVNPPALYKGTWDHGFKNGRGEEINPDGSKYVGNYVKGEKNGHGKLVYSEGMVYQGEFAQNKPQGIGIYQAKAQAYEGTWKNGKMHGVGRCQWYDTEQQGKEVVGRYFGQYREGIKQGYGEYTDSRGTVYKGMWLNGQLNESAPIDISNSGK